MKLGERFWSLLASSTLTSAAIALFLTSAACYMWITGRVVPDQMYALLYGVVGYFFMSKTAAEARSR